VSKYIDVFVDRKGGVKIETTGFSGNSCREATQTLESRLGKVISDETTAEGEQETEKNAGQFT